MSAVEQPIPAEGCMRQQVTVGIYVQCHCSVLIGSGQRNRRVYFAEPPGVHLVLRSSVSFEPSFTRITTLVLFIRHDLVVGLRFRSWASSTLSCDPPDFVQ